MAARDAGGLVVQRRHRGRHLEDQSRWYRASEPTSDSPGNDNHPSFSGDGRQIVFRSSRTGSFDLYLMNADGTNVRRLTNDAANDLFPVFSPMANRIAFMSDRDNAPRWVYDIYVMDLLEDGDQGRSGASQTSTRKRATWRSRPMADG